jgi:F-type H+-transporting ATPase subunit b
MINFLVLMFILNLLLYKPILKILDARDKRIADGQQKVKDFIEEGHKLVAVYNEKLQLAKVEALAIKNNTRKQAVDQVNAIIDEA